MTHEIFMAIVGGIGLAIILLCFPYLLLRSWDINAAESDSLERLNRALLPCVLPGFG